MVRHRVEQVSQVVCLGRQAQALAPDLVQETGVEGIAQGQVTEGDVVQGNEPVVVQDTIAPVVDPVFPCTCMGRLDVPRILKLLVGLT